MCKLWQPAPAALSPLKQRSPECRGCVIKLPASHSRITSFESRARDRITRQAVPHFPNSAITIPSNRPRSLTPTS